jgi:hypothetical protein
LKLIEKIIPRFIVRNVGGYSGYLCGFFTDFLTMIYNSLLSAHFSRFIINIKPIISITNLFANFICLINFIYLIVFIVIPKFVINVINSNFE